MFSLQARVRSESQWDWRLFNRGPGQLRQGTMPVAPGPHTVHTASTPPPPPFVLNPTPHVIADHLRGNHNQVVLLVPYALFVLVGRVQEGVKAGSP